MLVLLIVSYSSSLYSTHTIMQNKDKCNENTYTETHTLNPTIQRTSLLAYQKCQPSHTFTESLLDLNQFFSFSTSSLLLFGARKSFVMGLSCTSQDVKHPGGQNHPYLRTTGSKYIKVHHFIRTTTIIFTSFYSKGIRWSERLNDLGWSLKP